MATTAEHEIWQLSTAVVNKGKLIASHLCNSLRACWFYQGLWPDCHSSKQGWWVVLQGWAVDSEYGEILLYYTVLDPSMEHWSITVEDARVIVKTMVQRAVTSWMSELELGQDSNPHNKALSSPAAVHRFYDILSMQAAKSDDKALL
jgi:hypothetical protein